MMKKNYFSSSGFTIAELLVTVVLSTILIGVIFSFIIFSQNTFLGTVNNADVQQNARFAVDKMTSQLRASTRVLTDLSVPSNTVEFEDNSVSTPGTHHPRYIKFFLDGSGSKLQQSTTVYCSGASCCTSDIYDPVVSNGLWVPSNYSPAPTQCTPQIVDLAQYVSSVQFSKSNTIYMVSLQLKKGTGKSMNIQSSTVLRNTEIGPAGGTYILNPPGWVLAESSNGFGQGDMSYFDPNIILGKTKLVLTYELRLRPGDCLLGGDASAIVIQQCTPDDPYSCWRYISLSDYGNSCLSGTIQTVTIPLTDFYDKNNSPYPHLDTSLPVDTFTGDFNCRFWCEDPGQGCGAPWEVDIISAKVQ